MTTKQVLLGDVSGIILLPLQGIVSRSSYRKESNLARAARSPAPATSAGSTGPTATRKDHVPCSSRVLLFSTAEQDMFSDEPAHLQAVARTVAPFLRLLTEVRV